MSENLWRCSGLEVQKIPINNSFLDLHRGKHGFLWFFLEIQPGKQMCSFKPDWQSHRKKRFPGLWVKFVVQKRRIWRSIHVFSAKVCMPYHYISRYFWSHGAVNIEWHRYSHIHVLAFVQTSTYCVNMLYIYSALSWCFSCTWIRISNGSIRGWTSEWTFQALELGRSTGWSSQTTSGHVYIYIYKLQIVN